MTRLVFPDTPATPLPPTLFGQFLERPSWSGETGPESVCDERGRLAPDVVAMLADLRAPVIRFPGGTDADYMDWTDLIDHAPGRVGGRPVSRGRDGGETTNRFGLHEYHALLEQIGLPDSILTVNLRDALYRVRPLADAARHAAGLIAYVAAPLGAPLPAGMPDWPALRAANGHPEPWSLRWVSVGNESYFYWPPHDPAERARLGVETDEAAWAWFEECLVAYADALHAVSPSLHLVMDGLHDPWRPDNDVPNRHRDVLIRRPAIRARYHALASHYYAPMAFWSCTHRGRAVPIASLSDDTFWSGLLSAPGLVRADGQMDAFGSVYDAYTALGYRLAITEWNFNAFEHLAHFAGRAFNEFVPAALGAAGFLHGLLRHVGQIELAAQSMLLGSSWGITGIRAHPTGAVPPYWLPQGQVAWLYTRNHGDRVLATTLHDAPLLPRPARFANWYPEVETLSTIDAVATVDAGHLYLHVVNRDRIQSQSLAVALPPGMTPSSGTWIRLTLTNELLAPPPRSARPPILEACGRYESAELAIPLPPCSVSVIRVPRHPATG